MYCICASSSVPFGAFLFANMIFIEKRNRNENTIPDSPKNENDKDKKVHSRSY